MSHEHGTGLSESPPKGLASGLLPKANRASILLFLASTCFYWASLYTYVPILPVYAQSLGASLSMVGIVVASYALPQVVLRVPMGMWSDALGRRKPLVAAGIVMTLAGALVMGLAPNPLFLTVGRAVSGTGAAAWVILSVYFIAYYPAQLVGRAVGLINFVQSAALVVASAGGGLIAQAWGFQYVFFVAAVLGALALVALLPSVESRPELRSSFAWRDFARVAGNPHLLAVSGMGI
ncbi:MAG: MFS transporter, partial [Dehalococcoidia bacterium]|nr:MFS transporter [Dehalococcoidia bacterium]